MTQKMLSQQVNAIKGLDAVADAFSGTVRSDVVSAKNCDSVAFLIHKGVGATGTSTITVNACDDVTPTNRTAVTYRIKSNTSSDTWSAFTAVAAAGTDTTAGSSQLYWVEVDSDVIAATGYGYVELTCVEVVDSPVLGGIIVFQNGLRHKVAVQPTQIT